MSDLPAATATVESQQPALETRAARVVFQPAGRQGAVAAGTSLLDAARQLGVEIESICGGRQTCGKCQVRIESGQFSRYGIESSAENVSREPEREIRYRDKEGLMPGCRLACAALVQGDVLVTVPEESRAHKQVVRKAATERAVEVNPAVRPCYVELPPASLADERSDWARLRSELAQRFELDEAQLRIDPRLLPNLQPVLRAGMTPADGAHAASQATAVLWHDREVIGLLPGYHERAYGVAVDLGTTTMVAHLAELRTGRVLATESCMNPQITYGEDLMSRVSYVTEQPGGLAILHGAVIASLNDLIRRATGQVGLSPADVADLVVVGNSVMHHIFLGIDPVELGGAPFAPAVKEPVDVKARDLRIEVVPGAYVHMPPLEAGHVGADNVAVVIAEEPHRRDDVTLLIDVGTNGEIVLGNRERLLSASSPTGPAFEGAEVRHGMRAAPGAIERVRIDPATLAVRYKLIGREEWVDGQAEGAGSAGESQDADTGLPGASPPARKRPGRRDPEPLKAAGICGSGIIEAIAELFQAGLLDASGRFVAKAPTPRLFQDGLKGYFVLAWPEETSTGREIVIHSDDVRAIQLAKAALYAGAKLLMRHYGLERVDRIVLAGAFGSYIDPERAMLLGLIPDCDLEHVHAVGNAAGDGALILLLNRMRRLEAAEVAQWIEHVQTALHPDFQDEFVAAITLPNAVDPFPHLVPLLEEAAARRIIQPTTNGRGPGNRNRRSRRQVQAEMMG